MNKVLLIGRLTKDCTVRHTLEKKNPFLNFTLAVQKPYYKDNKKREADFIPVVYFKRWCESLAPYLNKGTLISLWGRVNVRSYDSEDGKKKYITQIIAEQIQLIESPNRLKSS